MIVRFILYIYVGLLPRLNIYDRALFMYPAETSSLCLGGRHIVKADGPVVISCCLRDWVIHSLHRRSHLQAAEDAVSLRR